MGLGADQRFQPDETCDRAHGRGPVAGCARGRRRSSPPARAPAPVHRLARGLAGAWGADAAARRARSMSGPTSRGTFRQAQYLNIETLRASKGGVPVQLLDAPWYRELFKRLGLDPAVPVVVYSAGETLNIDATFAVWILASHGTPARVPAGRRVFEVVVRGKGSRAPVSRRAFRRAAGGTRAPSGPSVATLADVQRGMQTGVLLRRCPPARPVRRRRRLPDAAGAPAGRGQSLWQDDLETVGFGRVFRPADSLRARYAAEGIVPDRDIILYCNSATEASHVFFVLKYLLGYPRVRIYAGSWTEWAEREDLPIERGSGPRYNPPLRSPIDSGCAGPRGPVALLPYHLLSHHVTTLRSYVGDLACRSASGVRVRRIRVGQEACREQASGAFEVSHMGRSAHGSQEGVGGST